MEYSIFFTFFEDDEGCSTHAHKNTMSSGPAHEKQPLVPKNSHSATKQYSNMASGVLEKLEDLLAKVLKTRLQRKAKAVIMSSVEFLLVDLAVLGTALEMELGSTYEKAGVATILGGSAVYVICLSLFMFCHALPDTVDSSTTQEVEEAYARTNKIPIWDGIMELPFPFKFKGQNWYVPYFAWGWAVFIIIWGIVLFGFGLEGPMDGGIAAGLTTTTQAALGAGAVLLYQITSDFSEYWVFSRPINRVDEVEDVADEMVAAVTDA